MSAVSVNESDGETYRRYVSGGPMEQAYLTLGDLEVVAYVNARYVDLDDTFINWRATDLFEVAGVGLIGDAMRGDALVVQAPGDGHYDRSLPADALHVLLNADD